MGFFRNTLSCIALCIAGGAAGGANAALWDVDAGNENVISIKADEQVRTDFDPNAFFGINVNYISFQRQVWDKRNSSARGDIEEYLAQMQGIRYRYPGGMVANGYSWQGAIGALGSRLEHKNLYGEEFLKPHFGLEEYLGLMDRVGGNFWYVLNIVGLNPRDPYDQSPMSAVGENNAKLVKHLLTDKRYAKDEHYFQLGNELDRSQYEWTYENYIARSRATMDAIFEVEPAARFVAFLRAFTYKYKKDKSRGESRPEELMSKVLKALPEIEDYSLMQYYDSTRTDGKSWSIPFWTQRISKTINHYRSIRDGKAPRVWITEHARQASTNRPGSDDSRTMTSNLGGVLATADYLTALVQIPEVAGTFWHGLNAGPWQLFDATVAKRDFSPRPIFYGLTLLRQGIGPIALATKTVSRNDSGYLGGYDIRSAAFAHENGDISLWVVNRNPKPTTIEVDLPAWAEQAVSAEHRFVGGRPGLSPDDPSNELQTELEGTILSLKFSKTARLALELPPASVSTFRLSRGK